MRLLMSVLSECRAASSCPSREQRRRTDSMSSWPIALVKIGSRYSIPIRDGSSLRIVERRVHLTGWMKPQRSRKAFASKLST